MIEAPLILVFFPLTLAWLIWVILFLANHPSEEIRHVKHHEFLGPGGPDDPFADEPAAAGADDRETERYQHLAREAKRLGFELTPTSSLPREAAPWSGESERRTDHVDYAPER